MRWNLKEAGCEEHTNSRANLWSDEQKSHMRSCMWVRQQPMLKPNNYTESCMINEADGWRGRNVWYLGRSVRSCHTHRSLSSEKCWDNKNNGRPVQSSHRFPYTIRCFSVPQGWVSYYRRILISFRAFQDYPQGIR